MNQTLFIVVLVLIVAAVIIMYIAPLAVYMSHKSKLISEDGPWDLNNQRSVLQSNIVSPLMKNDSSSFRIFYTISSIPRTSIQIDSATAPSTGICTVTADQTCVHPEFTKILSFGSSLSIELLNAPDASRPGLPLTQLCVKTKDTDKTYIETFPLPPFPMNKWIMISICRHGSRFDIYYNNRVVASVKTMKIPYLTDTTARLGGVGVKGQAVGAVTAESYWTASEISSDYSVSADTRGKPYILAKINGFDLSSISLCPSGDCFKGPSVRPANPLIQWTSQYN